MKQHRQGLLVGCCLAALTSLLSGNTRAEFKPVDANTVVDLTGHHTSTLISIIHIMRLFKAAG
jgi:hypothetical protein